jgi:eukaryotic-like serine/threonine-protein kinase
MKKTTAWIKFLAFSLLTAFFLLTALFIADLFVFPFLQGKFTDKVSMPDLRQLDSASAVRALEKTGFRLGEVSSAHNDSVPSGRVVCQTPMAGEEVKKKRRVRFTLSLGREMVIVPDLKDLSPSEASDTLQRIGLHLGETRELFSDRLTPGAIISTTPAAGRRMARGSVVNITISQNNQMGQTYVPDFQNVALDQARIMLGKASLRLRQTVYRETHEVVPRTVLEQSLKAGSRVEKDTYIDFVVSE